MQKELNQLYIVLDQYERYPLTSTIRHALVSINRIAVFCLHCMNSIQLHSWYREFNRMNRWNFHYRMLAVRSQSGNCNALRVEILR